MFQTNKRTQKNKTEKTKWKIDRSFNSMFFLNNIIDLYIRVKSEHLMRFVLQNDSLITYFIIQFVSLSSDKSYSLLLLPERKLHNMLCIVIN